MGRGGVRNGDPELIAGRIQSAVAAVTGAALTLGGRLPRGIASPQ